MKVANNIGKLQGRSCEFLIWVGNLRKSWATWKHSGTTSGSITRGSPTWSQTRSFSGGDRGRSRAARVVSVSGVIAVVRCCSSKGQRSKITDNIKKGRRRRRRVKLIFVELRFVSLRTTQATGGLTSLSGRTSGGIPRRHSDGEQEENFYWQPQGLQQGGWCSVHHCSQLR